MAQQSTMLSNLEWQTTLDQQAALLVCQAATTTALSVGVHQRDSEENTPLHLAVACAEEANVALQLVHGANPNAQNVDGYSALHTAVSQGLLHSVWMLLRYGANPNLCTVEEVSPLHIAVANGQEKIAICLLQFGAFVNAQDENGETSLHISVRESRPDLLQLLLQCGAQPNVANTDGETPLHLAAVCGEIELARALLGGGAALLFDACGRSPVDEAKENGFQDLFELLAPRVATAPCNSNKQPVAAFAPASWSAVPVHI